MMMNELGIGDKISTGELRSLNKCETIITMGRIIFKRHCDLKENLIEWRIWRLNDDNTATLVDYGFRKNHLVGLAKQLVEVVL